MNRCTIHDAGTIELFFYDELPPDQRAEIAEHLHKCSQCRTAVDELHVIRAALANRADISAPPSGDWSGFMARLDEAVVAESRAAAVVPFEARRLARPPLTGLLAMAALLAIVTASVFFASQAGRRATGTFEVPPPQIADSAPDASAPIQSGLASVSARHLERSKLVVLGLATRESGEADSSDWTYERELATSLLNDTRLYRMAAEQRGLTSLAGVMRDLELVLLQTSMAETTDETALPQIQRLIRKRGLVEKMDVVGTTGLVP